MGLIKPERLIKVGITPSLTTYYHRLFVKASPSLWQRHAKHEFARMIERGPRFAKDAEAQRARASFAICCLLVAFHESAPQEVEISRAQFDGSVRIALSSPVSFRLLGSNEVHCQSKDEVDSVLRDMLVYEKRFYLRDALAPVALPMEAHVL